MNRRAFIRAGALAFSSALLRDVRAVTRDAWTRALDMAREVSAPRFPERVFDITRFGATAAGVLSSAE